MSLNAKDIPTNSNYERPDPIDPGTYPARVVTIATLGIQPQRPFKGEDKAPILELMVTYELLDEFMKDEDGNDILDKPRWITETFPFHNLEADRAKSTKRYFALDPASNAGGDWSQLIETPCMVTVVVEEGKGKNAGKFYENVSTVSSMRPKEAAKAGPLVNNPVVFDFYEPDEGALKSLPNWIKKKMAGAVDYEGSDVSKMIRDIGDTSTTPAGKKFEKAAPTEEDDGIPW